MTVLTHRAKFVATKCMNPNLANRPNLEHKCHIYFPSLVIFFLQNIHLSTMTCELTNRKCIWRKVKRACRIGWAITMSSTQLVSIVACMAISRPMKISVPRPKTVG